MGEQGSVGDAALTAVDFPVRRPVDTRWSDNDVFGHLNNAVYYELFDSVINGWLRAATGVDARTAAALPVVAESGCRYFRDLAFPQLLDVGLAVTRLGRTSVIYRLGVFERGPASTTDEARTAVAGATAAAVGRWVHVYVDTQTRRPVDIPAEVRAVLSSAVTA